MKHFIKLTIICCSLLYVSSSIAQTNQEYNPYESIGQKAEVLTLSKGKYIEFFDLDSIEIIGDAILNTNTMKVIGFIERDTSYSEATLEPEIVSRWLSRDPLAHKRSWVSPYNFVQNNPISRIDPTGALDGEFKEVVSEDGTKTTTKISDLGDAEGVDFTHITGGTHDGQTRIKSQGTGQEVYMKSSSNIEGFTKRDGGINWNTIYDEFLSGNGPENSLISTSGMLQGIMQSPQFAEAFQAYLGAGAPAKMGYNPSFGITGSIEAGDNMTAQMIGKASYSFYNVGNKLVITIMDSKSVMSYSLNPLIKALPESWVNEDRSSSSDPVPQGTTRQTYLMMLDIKKE